MTPAAAEPLSISQAYQRAVAKWRAGLYAEAHDLCRAIVRAEPGHPHAWTLLGEILLRQGFEDEALVAFDNSSRLLPGAGQAFTRAAIIRFRRHWGPPRAARRLDAGAPRLQASQLGLAGRFGNQLLQYAVVRLYAARHGLQAEFPDWIGRDLFDLNDPLTGSRLPPIDAEQVDLLAGVCGAGAPVLRNVDVHGYFCGDTSVWSAAAPDFRRLFAPDRRLRTRLATALARLAPAGRTLVAVHLRRGDFLQGPHWIAPESWYTRWLERIWGSLERPVLFVASDDPACVEAFGRFAPLSAADLACELPGAPFLLDHYVLANADLLAISNSTFSFTAAMLNQRARQFLRPHPDLRMLVPFDPWRAMVLLKPTVSASLLSDAERRLFKSYADRGATVVHYGSACTPFTCALQAFAPTLRVYELEPPASLDRLRLRLGLSQISLVALGEDAELEELLRQAAFESFAMARIDAILIPTAARARRQSLVALQALGYRLLRLGMEALEPAAELAPQSGAHLLMHERLWALTPGTAAAPAADLGALCVRFAVEPRTVLHVGANQGEELSTYEGLGASHIVLVEANPAVYARLRTMLAGRSNLSIVQRAISDRTATVTLVLASSDRSSSLLPPAEHRQGHPMITATGSVEIEACTLDSLLSELGIRPEEIGLVVIDVQGAEALALRGAQRVLRHARAVYIAVSFAELYRGAAQIEDVELILAAAGFTRVSLHSPFHATWAYALYVRLGSPP